MKMAFFEIKPEEKAFFEQHLAGHELFFFDSTLNEAVTEPKDYEVVSVFVHSRVTNEILQKLPNLQYLQTRSTGYDHLKCEDLQKRAIQVSNVAGYAGPAVAEFAFSLLLNATRKTHIALARAKQRNFDYQDLKGTELFGKTLGILGLGTIGSQMACIGKGFGMRLLAFSEQKTPLVEALDMDFCDLDKVLTESDVLMLALPLTPETAGIINANNVKKLKQEAIIVNVARGALIEDRLYGQLKNIFCLDVITDTKYVNRENILYTPHMAYYTEEALQRIMQISLQNIEAFLSHQPLPNALKLSCE